MEYAQGDLFAILEDDRSMPLDELQKLAGQLVSALQYLHSNRIIHRDMKPQNILLSADGTVKLCDFGFARSMSAATNMVTSVKGTPLYMAPEVVQQQPYDFRADLWSLGVILFELYTGEPPFYTESIYKLVDLILKQAVPWPQGMPHQLRSFLGGLLQKDARDRLAWPQLAQHPFVLSGLPVVHRDAPEWRGQGAFSGAHLVFFGDAQDPASPSKQPLAPIPMRIAQFSATGWATLQQRVKTLGANLATPKLSADANLSAHCSAPGTPIAGSPSSNQTSKAVLESCAPHVLPAVPASTGCQHSSARDRVHPAASSSTTASASYTEDQPGQYQASQTMVEDSVDSVDSAVGRLLRRAASPADIHPPSASGGVAEESLFWQALQKGDFGSASQHIHQLRVAAPGGVEDWGSVWRHVAAVVEEPISAAVGSAKAEECLRCVAAALQFHASDNATSSIAATTANVVDDVQLLLDEALSALSVHSVPSADAASRVLCSSLIKLIEASLSVIGHIYLIVWNHTNAQCLRLGLQSVSQHAASVLQALQRFGQELPQQLERTLAANAKGHSASTSLFCIACGLALAASCTVSVDCPALRQAVLSVPSGEERSLTQWLLQPPLDCIETRCAARIVAACCMLRQSDLATVGNALVVSAMYSKPSTEAGEAPPETSITSSGLLLVSAAMAAHSAFPGYALPVVAQQDSGMLQADLCTFWLSGSCPNTVQGTQQASQLRHALAYTQLKSVHSSQSEVATAVASVLRRAPSCSPLTKLFIEACISAAKVHAEVLFTKDGTAYFMAVLNRAEPALNGAVFKLLARSLAIGVLPHQWLAARDGGHALLDIAINTLQAGAHSSASSRKWATCLVGNLLFVKSSYASESLVQTLLWHAQQFEEAAVQENTAAACINAMQAHGCTGWLLDAGVVDWITHTATSAVVSATTRGLLCKLSCNLVLDTSSGPYWKAAAQSSALLLDFLQTCPQAGKVPLVIRALGAIV